ncbi:MAG: HhH-GPD-type base excision DNA repair protein [Gaiellaceae bacterium]
MATTRPDRLHFTEDDAANELIAREPLALLIGFALDQQVTVPTAFQGPLKLKRRLGTLDARTLAETAPARLDEVFREKPAIHRFPGAMASRVQELAAAVVDEYGGEAERLWTEAGDGADLKRRIAALPGFGEMKVTALAAVLAKRFGVEAAQDLLPDHPTLGDVDSPEALASYQEAKRAHKAAQRAKRG